MNIIAIDPGRYSIKFTYLSLNRKDVQLYSQEEISIPKNKQNQSDYSYQIEIIGDYLRSLKNEEKITLSIPSEFMSYRFIDIPIKSLKKAEKTIPFQIEDSLPYSISKTHLAYQIDRNQNDGCSAQVSIIQKEDFQEWIDSIAKWPKKVSFVSQGAFTYPDFFKNQQDLSNVLLIDIGHYGARGFFINQGNLVDSQYSYFGGNKLTEAISDFYKIDYLKAQQFKHHTGFFITNDLDIETDKNQKAFGQLMHQSCAGFLQEIQRWIVNYKISSNNSVDRILLTGGGSLCQNFEKYLSEQLELPVFYFDSFINVSTDINKSEKLLYNNSYSTAISYKKRNKLANLLTGEFASESEDDIPVHSMGFLALRVCLVCLLFIFGFAAERYFLSEKENKLNRLGNRSLKNPTLIKAGIKRRSFKKSPKRIQRKLKSLIKGLKDEESALAEAQRIDGVTPLIDISNQIKSKDISLQSWESTSSQFASGVFKSEKITSLYALKKRMEAASYPDLTIQMNNKNKQLVFRFNVGENQ